MGMLIPLAGLLPKYPRNLFRADLVSGMTVWGVIAPAAMAYAELAVCRGMMIKLSAAELRGRV